MTLDPFEQWQADLYDTVKRSGPKGRSGLGFSGDEKQETKQKKISKTNSRRRHRVVQALLQNEHLFRFKKRHRQHLKQLLKRREDDLGKQLSRRHRKRLKKQHKMNPTSLRPKHEKRKNTRCMNRLNHHSPITLRKEKEGIKLANRSPKKTFLRVRISDKKSRSPQAQNLTSKKRKHRHRHPKQKTKRSPPKRNRSQKRKKKRRNRQRKKFKSLNEH
jgi:hypothetical protein